MTAAHLEVHPPARSQYRKPRRAKPTGCIVLHTFQAPVGRTAKWGADFIAGRTDAAGSYHRLGDVHRDEIQLVPYEWEAFHDGTGSNRWSIGLSLMMNAADWPTLAAAEEAALLGTMVSMAHHAAAWLRSEHGIVVPAHRITKAESDQGMAGFIAHGARDPGRRSDPGPDFPWAAFLSQYALTGDPPPMPTKIETTTRRLQEALNRLGYGLKVDDIAGEQTLGAALNAIPALDLERTALKATVTDQLRILEEERRLAAAHRERLAELEAAIDLEVVDPADDRRKAMVLEAISPNIIEAAELLAEMAAAVEVDRG